MKCLVIPLKQSIPGEAMLNVSYLCSSDEAEVERDVDLAVGASDILFQMWSGIYLRDELADQMLRTVQQVSITTSTSGYRLFVTNIA